MYVKNTYDLGEIRQVEKYYPGNYGAPGCKRQPKRKKTPEFIERQNQRIREKKIQRLILANFKEGDWHLTLTERKELRSEDAAEAKKRIRDFMTKMRRAYKRANVPFKYIYVTEKGKRGAWHHHIILEDIGLPQLNTKKTVISCWPWGQRNFSPLYEDGEFEDLAAYIVKKETKDETEGCSYSRSRNMIIPKPEREIIHSRRWAKDPRPPSGWELVKESLVNGINPVTGYPYQHYTLRRARQREGPKIAMQSNPRRIRGGGP